MTDSRSTDWRPAALFVLAYTCSGLAGLVYEVTWTRLLTLHLGHTTAAGSAVVGAFLLGLAGGGGMPAGSHGTSARAPRARSEAKANERTTGMRFMGGWGAPA